MLKVLVILEVSDVYFMVVLILFKGNYELDVSYVEVVICVVLLLLKEGDFYVIEFILFVGIIEVMVCIIFGECLELESKIFIVYCLECVLLGNVIYELVYNDWVIGGLNFEFIEKVIVFYL